jgi:DNA-binding SARP family transcriptional activator
MLRLKTFGELSLERDGTLIAGAPAQRRKLALLAYLAAAGDRGVSRDTLLTVFWPESSADSGRHALTQTVSALRRELRCGDLVVGTAALQLNARAIQSDVADFQRNCEAGQLEQAVELYAGPFLDGVHLSGTSEFERWVEVERARFARESARALEQLAEREITRGDHQAAAGWWRRLADADPLNSRLALALMHSLAASGNRAAALRHAAAHAALLREELDVAPDPEITALERRLRKATEDAPFIRGEQRAGSATPATFGAAAVESGRRYLDHVQHALADRYELGEQLERGSASTAFRARTLPDRRAVTLRVLHPTLGALLDAARFVADMRHVASVAHPAVAQLLDAGEAGDVVYYASVPVEGSTLRSRLADERQLSVGEALHIAHGVAGALRAAHHAGVLHLDLKPRHVLLASRGAVVAELGVAPAIAVAAGEGLTGSGVTLGTPAYMSPEQASGEERLDGRSDVYSLGCIIYQMLAGEPPFAGPTAQAVLIRRLTESVPPLRASRGSLSAALERVLARMLARVPADRFRTAAEAEAALEGALNAEPTRSAAQREVVR